MQSNKQFKSIKEKGIALVIVLWMMVLLTIMAASYSKTMRTETLLTAHQLQSSQSRALAEAGFWLAIQELLKPELEQDWRHDGSTQSIEYGDGKIDISIQDETGKIDLNTARIELLQSLLQSAELGYDDANALVHAILDWRDRDNLRRESGAEDDDYSSAGLDYGAKDGPFNSVDELRRVLSMNESIFQAIRPALTVHSHQPGINPAVAPKETLLAIPNISVDSVGDFLAERESETNNNMLPGGVDNRFFSRAKGRTFTITSEGQVADTKLRLDVVVLMKRNAKPPFSVLSWWEAKAAKQLVENFDDNQDGQR